MYAIECENEDDASSEMYYLFINSPTLLTM